MQLAPAPELVARFASGLDRLVGLETSLGIAVSGGPDSVALLLLAASARPGRVKAATVDHGMRPESAAEAAAVAQLCQRLDVPHTTLKAQWDEPPATAVQERARAERYRLLGQWVRERSCEGLVTAHHLNDQVETFLMRLMRGAGVRGLAAMRPVGSIPGAEVSLVRPLLGWTRAELRAICAGAGVETVADPSNEDERFERARVRDAIAGADWLDPQAIARSAANLQAAESALEWAAEREWQTTVTLGEGRISYTPGEAPDEIRRRIVERALRMLATEGKAVPLGGRELEQLLQTLASGASATLRGVRCSGGEVWRLEPAPARRQS